MSVVNDGKSVLADLAHLISWAERNERIKGLMLTGSRASGTAKVDNLSDFDIAVITNDLDFIQNDQWLDDVQEHWVCVHDHYGMMGFEVPTRLVIFHDELKIDFSFLGIEVLHKIRMVLPDGFNLGYWILLNKAGTLDNLPQPTDKAFLLQKPAEADFRRNVNEFWFEAYHVAKYLARNDLWAAKSRDWSAKRFLLEMLKWHQGTKKNWEFSPGPDGKEMMNWVEAGIREKLQHCFGTFERESSWIALGNTVQLYSEIANQTGHSLNYQYNEGLDVNISTFIKKLMKQNHSKSNNFG